MGTDDTYPLSYDQFNVLPDDSMCGTYEIGLDSMNGNGYFVIEYYGGNSIASKKACYVFSNIELLP